MFNRIMHYFERWYPFAGCFGTFLILHLRGISLPEVYAPQVANAFFTIFAVLLGFISASLSIFFSIQDRKFIKTLKTSGAFGGIIKYHYRSMLWCFTAIFLAFITTVSTGKEAVFECSLVGKLLMAIGFGAMLSFFRVSHMLCMVLSLDSAK